MSSSVRLLPLVAFAALCLLALKIAGLTVSGGYILTGTSSAKAQEQEEMAKEKAGDKEEKSSSKEDPSGDKKMAKEKEKSGPSMSGPAMHPQDSEHSILQSLSKRRKALDQREKDFELKKNLLAAAEKRINARIEELKAIESQVSGAVKKREEIITSRYGKLVTIYSKMKPKDAARLFNRLDLRILTGLVGQMKAKSMSAILAAMDTAKAERLTLAIATEEGMDRNSSKILPKIRGKSSK